MTIESKVPKDRLYHLDLIRFIAAIYVVFYHYGFRGYAKDDLSSLQFPLIEEFSKYGYLGVDLFFIISGFVILMSAKNSNIVDFCISRFTRLYPAFWFCVILSAIVIALYGGIIFNITWSQFLVNLTMLNEFVGIEHIDGVYWSLVIELKFYMLIAILLYFKKINYIKILGISLLIIAVMQIIIPISEAPKFLKIIYYITFARWSPYFVAGMFFFLMKSEKNILKNSVPVIAAYVIAMINAIVNVQYRNDLYNFGFSKIVVGCLVTSFFVSVFLISIGKLQIFNKKSFLYLGVLTYPLYLIHQNIGYIIFNNLGESINKWVLLIIVIVLMLITSYLISRYIEKPLGTYMRNSLKSNKLILKLKAKI